MTSKDDKQVKNGQELPRDTGEAGAEKHAESSNGSSPTLVRVAHESLRQRVIDTTSDLVRTELSSRDTGEMQGTLNHLIVLLRRQIIERRERAETLLREAEADEFAAERAASHLKIVEEERRSPSKEAI